jgi:16S rRNA (uracil1498-N3)-methyltransferase
VNFVLLEPSDFVAEDHVRLQGRRLEHVRKIHRAGIGDELRVGLVGAKLGHGRIERIDDSALDMLVEFDDEPPAKLPLRLVLALPRPKVLNRTIAAAVSMGISEIDLINSWRVEKAYWKSPRLSVENLRMQSVLGLEQGGDTVLPRIRLHRLFTPFVREELPGLIKESLALVAHPQAPAALPRECGGSIVLAIGPEGGFIEQEVQTFRDIGFTAASLGPRILRVETAVAYLVGRLF